MGKKSGRPPKQEASRSVIMTIALTPKEKSRLNMCSEELGICKTDAIMKGITLLEEKLNIHSGN